MGMAFGGNFGSFLEFVDDWMDFLGIFDGSRNLLNLRNSGILRNSKNLEMQTPLRSLKFLKNLIILSVFGGFWFFGFF